MNDRPGLKVIDAKVPLSEMFSYTTELRSMTQGRGSFMMEFDHYEPVPQNVTQLIIEGKEEITLKNPAPAGFFNFSRWFVSREGEPLLYGPPPKRQNSV